MQQLSRFYLVLLALGGLIHLTSWIGIGLNDDTGLFLGVGLVDWYVFFLFVRRFRLHNSADGWANCWLCVTLIWAFSGLNLMIPIHGIERYQHLKDFHFAIPPLTIFHAVYDPIQAHCASIAIGALGLILVIMAIIHRCGVFAKRL